MLGERQRVVIAGISGSHRRDLRTGVLGVGRVATKAETAVNGNRRSSHDCKGRAAESCDDLRYFAPRDEPACRCCLDRAVDERRVELGDVGRALDDLTWRDSVDGHLRPQLDGELLREEDQRVLRETVDRVIAENVGAAEMLTMRPQPALFIPGATHWDARKAALTFASQM
jgi:hypothetical protein